MRARGLQGRCGADEHIWRPLHDDIEAEFIVHETHQRHERAAVPFVPLVYFADNRAPDASPA